MGTAANYTPTPYVRTTDIASNAISNFVEVSNANSLGLVNSGTIVLQGAITTGGGMVNVIGKMTFAEGDVRATGVIRLRRDGAATGTLLDTSNIYMATSGQEILVMLNKLDTPASGVHSYSITQEDQGGAGTFVRNRSLQMTEYLR